jgi:hypothetical protein
VAAPGEAHELLFVCFLKKQWSSVKRMEEQPFFDDGGIISWHIVDERSGSDRIYGVGNPV